MADVCSLQQYQGHECALWIFYDVCSYRTDEGCPKVSIAFPPLVTIHTQDNVRVFRDRASIGRLADGVTIQFVATKLITRGNGNILSSRKKSKKTRGMCEDVTPVFDITPAPLQDPPKVRETCRAGGWLLTRLKGPVVLLA